MFALSFSSFLVAQKKKTMPKRKNIKTFSYLFGVFSDVAFFFFKNNSEYLVCICLEKHQSQSFAVKNLENQGKNTKRNTAYKKNEKNRVQKLTFANCEITLLVLTLLRGNGCFPNSFLIKSNGNILSSCYIFVFVCFFLHKVIFFLFSLLRNFATEYFFFVPTCFQHNKKNDHKKAKNVRKFDDLLM